MFASGSTSYAEPLHDHDIDETTLIMSYMF